MPVPLLDVNAQNLPLADELTEVFRRVLRSGRFILGEEVEAFEAECAALVGAPHAVAVSSGTDALIAALMAAGIGPGDEVLCPSFTFFATAGSIHRVGAVPVFCDVDPVHFNLDLSSAAAKLTPRTKAILPVHLFGQAAAMAEILALAKTHRLVVIEDAAQAIGAAWDEHGCGASGDFGCFSFFPSKNLGGFGDGGLVTAREAEHAEHLRRLRNHGMHPKYHHGEVGGNFRMDALQCALLRVKLRHYDGYTAGRRRNAAWYTEQLSALPGVAVAGAPGAGEARVVLPVAGRGKYHIWNQYTLRVTGGRRDALRDHLAARGIGCEIYYPVPLHRQECFRLLPPHALRDCPVADRLAAEVISLPVYPELAEPQLAEVAAAIADFLR